MKESEECIGTFNTSSRSSLLHPDVSHSSICSMSEFTSATHCEYDYGKWYRLLRVLHRKFLHIQYMRLTSGMCDNIGKYSS